MPAAVERAFARLAESEHEHEPGALAAAFDAIRHLGDLPRAQSGTLHLAAPSAELRLAAAHALLALLPSRDNAARETLDELMCQGDKSTQTDAALCLGIYLGIPVMPKAGPVSCSRHRLGLQSLGWAGRIDAVPTLIDHLDDPLHSRIAAASLSMVTGADPVRDEWQSAHTPPASKVGAESSAIPAVDPDAGAPWPSRVKFMRWWTAHRDRFDASTRYLGGLPITRSSLADILRRGPLPWRRLAAMHGQRLTGTPLFPVHMPAPIQSAFLASPSSGNPT